MQQSIGESCRRLERVTEGVTEIEQRPFAGLPLVTADNRSLHAAAHRNGVLARRPAREHVAPVRLEPGEEGGISDQSVFRHFGISRAELAWRQCIEQRRVGEDQDRLMKRADQVLAMAGIYRGLAADRGIDLRQ